MGTDHTTFSIWFNVVGSDCITSFDHGIGIFVYIVLLLLCFYITAKICEEFLTVALEQICNAWLLNSDVSGASILAFSSSAPEILLSFCTTFILESSGGTGCIAGAALFGLLFVVGISVVVNPNRCLEVTKKGIIRDVCSNCVCVGILIIITNDQKVQWYESLLLVVSYVLYILFIWYNQKSKVVINNLSGKKQDTMDSFNDERNSKKSFDGTKSDESVQEIPHRKSSLCLSPGFLFNRIPSEANAEIFPIMPRNDRPSTNNVNNTLQVSKSERIYHHLSPRNPKKQQSPRLPLSARAYHHETSEQENNETRNVIYQSAESRHAHIRQDSPQPLQLPIPSRCTRHLVIPHEILDVVRPKSAHGRLDKNWNAGIGSFDPQEMSKRDFRRLSSLTTSSGENHASTILERMINEVDDHPEKYQWPDELNRRSSMLSGITCSPSMHKNTLNQLKEQHHLDVVYPRGSSMEHEKNVEHTKTKIADSEMDREINCTQLQTIAADTTNQFGVQPSISSLIPVSYAGSVSSMDVSCDFPLEQAPTQSIEVKTLEDTILQPYQESGDGVIKTIRCLTVDNKGDVPSVAGPNLMSLSINTCDDPSPASELRSDGSLTLRLSSGNLRDMLEEEKKLNRRQVWLRRSKRPCLSILSMIMPSDNRYYLLLFVCIVWLGGISFIIVDTAHRLGCMINIPPMIFALLFLSPAASIPDVYNSIQSSRQGYGDMAVSNAMGSTFMNITLGLGLPWFIRSISKEGLAVNLNLEEGLLESLIIFLGALAIYTVAVSLNRWKINMTIGIGLLFGFIGYITYIIISIVT